MKKTGLLLVFFFAFFAVFLACFVLTGASFEGLLRFSDPFEDIAETAYDGHNFAVLDNYRTRVMYLSPDGVTLGKAAARDDAEFSHIAIAKGAAYAVERTPDGDSLVMIRANGSVARHPMGEAILDLLDTDQGLYTLRKEGSALRMEPVDMGASRTLPFSGESPWKATMAPSGELYVLEYNGKIWNVSQDELVFDPDGVLWEEHCVPGDLAVDRNGVLWIDNLGSRRIGKVVDGMFVPVFSQEDVIAQGHAGVDNEGYYTFSMNGVSGNILTAISNTLILRESSGRAVTFTKSGNAPLLIAGKCLALLSAVAAVVSLLILVILGLSKVKKANVSVLMGQAIQFVVFVIVFGVAVGVNFVQSYQMQFELFRESWLKQTTLLGAMDISQSGVLNISGDDHAGAQRVLNEKLNAFIRDNANEIHATVVVVDDEMIRVLARTQDEVPLYYPLRADLRSETEGGVSYRASAEQGMISFGIVEDQRGRWETCLCPIFDADGKVAALLDVRTDADRFRKENSGLIIETILSAASVLAVALFFFIEVNRLMAVMMERPGAGKTLADHRRSLVRWLGFLAYTAINIPMFFIPILAGQIYQSGAPAFLSREMAIALPLTGNMLAMAVSSMACAGLVERKGWKPAGLIGVALCVAGYALAMLVENIFWFIGMLFVAGAGVGLLTLSLQTFIFASAPPEDTESDRLLSLLNSGIYAGVNCGVIFGSLLADQIGYFAAFLCAIGVFGLTALCMAHMLKNCVVSGADAGERQRGMSLIRYLLNGRVLIFLIALLVPITALSFFVAHFLPIFANRSGISSTIASWGYLLNGIAIIYLGPVFTRFLLKRVGSRKAVLTTSGIALAGIAIFAAFPAIPAAFVASLLLGISDAGGQVSRQDAFLNLPHSRRAGASRTLSTMSLFENIGQTIGPGVFSLILATEVQFGMLVLAIAVIGCFGLYWVTSGRSKAGTEKVSAGA